MNDDVKLGKETIANDESQIEDRLLEAIKQVSRNRMRDGPVRRFNQPKSLGCFDAEFRILEDLPEQLRQGIFSKPDTYPARVRFANATKFDDREKDFRGLSIRVRNVSGDTVWGEQGLQDFVMNSFPALFARHTRDFLALTKAIEKGRRWSFFINPFHLKSLLIVLRGREKIDNPFNIRYWSTTPYRFGLDESVAVKYSVQPCQSVAKNDSSLNGPDRLIDAMAHHLDQAPACFDFMVQFQKDSVKMPIEDSAVTWDESVSPFIKVAQITIRPQNFRDADCVQICENSSFNPWQALVEHKPLGGINRARKRIYAEMAEFRREMSSKQE